MLTAVPSLKTSYFLFLFFFKKVFQKVCSSQDHSGSLHSPASAPHHPVSVPPLSPCTRREGTNPTQRFLLSPSPSLLLWMLCSTELSQVPHPTLQTPPSPWPAPDHCHTPSLLHWDLLPASTTSANECWGGRSKQHGQVVPQEQKIVKSKIILGMRNLSYRPLCRSKSELIAPNIDTPIHKQISEEGWDLRFQISLKQIRSKDNRPLKPSCAKSNHCIYSVQCEKRNISPALSSNLNTTWATESLLVYP